MIAIKPRLKLMRPLVFAALPGGGLLLSFSVSGLIISRTYRVSSSF